MQIRNYIIKLNDFAAHNDVHVQMNRTAHTITHPTYVVFITIMGLLDIVG